jgi:hypothetical protein
LFRDAFLSKKLSEELFCRLAGVSFLTFQSTLDAVDSVDPIPRFQKFLVALSILDDKLGFAVNC